MKKTKKAFSFVELVIVLAILIVLGVIWMSMISSNKQKSNNSKLEFGIKTIKNSIISYKQQNKVLPTPSWNRNYFKPDSSYSHSSSTGSFWVYWSVTEDTLPKMFMDLVPLDPVSNHYYSYWKTLNNQYFEIAWIFRKDDKVETKLEWDYPWDYGPIGLIREYNWPFFVTDKNAKHLPYNPYEHVVSAKIWDIKWSVLVNGSEITGTKHLKEWDKIVTKASSHANIYFSDGSVSSLLENSQLTLTNMSYKDESNNLITTIKIFLGKWAIFTKATSLSDIDWDGNPDSAFEVYTWDTTAAVRWTIFYVSVDKDNGSDVVVLEWSVLVYKKPTIDNEDRPTSLEKNGEPEIVDEKNKVNINNGNIVNSGSLGEEGLNDLIGSSDKTTILEDNFAQGVTIDDIKDAIKKEEASGKKTCRYWFERVSHWKSKDFYRERNGDTTYCNSHKAEFKCDDWKWVDDEWKTKSKAYKFRVCGLGFCNKKSKKYTISGSANKKDYTLLGGRLMHGEIGVATNKKDDPNFDYFIDLKCNANTQEFSVVNKHRKKPKCFWEDECNNNPNSKNSPWKLYSYAYYNKPWDINMYFDDWVMYSDNWMWEDEIQPWNYNMKVPKRVGLSSGKIIGNSAPIHAFCKDNETDEIEKNSFCYSKNKKEKWVFIDSTGNDDFIKYKGLDLSWNFLIEMRVNIKKDGKKKYLIDSKYFQLYMQEDNKIRFQETGQTEKYTFILKDNINEWFYTISLEYISIGNQIKLNGWNSEHEYNYLETELENNKNVDIVIWAWEINPDINYKNQINNVIDYIKIYKRN